MRKLVEAALEDLSSGEVFLFRVLCGCCGTGYGNRPMHFSRTEASPSHKGEQMIRNVLYEQEWKTAKQIAIRNAAEQMNYCPVCRQLVCNQCFLICEELDLCRQCAARLDQRGSPVLTSTLEAN